ncbi:DHHC palmitoyltransferase-domain-containing protein [Mrakia frigida]|uniref:DHHC family palmitoyltransferase n=1 Tax=Mrakia frigida TaxID=29902 RepID=UPI003FCC049F
MENSLPSSPPSHLPADPTPSSSSSRASSSEQHLRHSSTDTSTPLSAALQHEKPPSSTNPPAQKPKKKFHIKTFRETIEENLAKAEAKAGSSDSWLGRKFAIGLVVAIMAWTSYVVIGRICVPMLHGTSRVGSRGRGTAFLVIFSILLFPFFWSYTKIVLTGPGFAKDYVPPFQIPTNPYHLQPHTPLSNPQAISNTSPPPTPSLPAFETDEQRPPSPRPTNPLPIPPPALPPSSALPKLTSNHDGGLCSSPPLLAQRRAEEGASGARQDEGEWVERFPFEPEVHGRWCGFCEIVKPERSHHCRMCGTCVLNMDHHCPWVGTCVGARNHKFFLVFVIYSTFFSVYSLIISAISLRGSEYDPMIISIIVLSVLFTAFTASMTWTHAFLILVNMSTIETLRVASFRERESAALQRRHGFFPTATKRANLARLRADWGSPYKEGNPFWLGTRRNWTAVMGEETWKWFLPLGGPRDGKRGEVYEKNLRCGERGEWRKREEWPEELR